jgi:hypothetical protein
VICLAMNSLLNSTGPPDTCLAPSQPMSVIATAAATASTRLAEWRALTTVLVKNKGAAEDQSHQDSPVAQEATTESWTETLNSFSRIQVSRPKRR